MGPKHPREDPRSSGTEGLCAIGPVNYPIDYWNLVRYRARSSTLVTGFLIWRRMHSHGPDSDDPSRSHRLGDRAAVSQGRIPPQFQHVTRASMMGTRGPRHLGRASQIDGRFPRRCVMTVWMTRLSIVQTVSPLQMQWSATL